MTAVPNATAGAMLRSYIDRYERLEDDRRAVVDDMAEVIKELKGQGFDAKVFRKVIARRREGLAKAQEFEALVELYHGAIGDMNGTPLGEAARRRMSRPAPDDDDGGVLGGGGDAGDEGGEGPSAPAGDADTSPAEPERRITEADIETARVQGGEDCQAGKKILDNPYVAGDPRRAAWDEGWCFHAGSDGMDIPAAWRRTPKPKADKPKAQGKGGETAAPPVRPKGRGKKGGGA